MDDGKLLTEYVRDGSEAAFSQIVTRHRTLVYATCLREIGSPSQAEDAAQVVFLLLSRKSKHLRPSPSLAGWLFRTARFVAKDVRKQEARRSRREEIVVEEMAPRPHSPAPEWQRVEPLLNGALSALRPADRELILLRFLEGLSLSETGAALGLSEDAARMRVTRAIEKMRRWLKSHGASVTSIALTGLLTAEATRPIPTRAAEAITQGTLQAISASPTASVLLLSKGVSHTMKIAQLKIAALAACVVLGGAVSVSSLAQAISQKHLPRPRAASPSALPAIHRQAFQVGMTARGRDLQGEDIVQGVSNLSQLDDQPSAVNAETLLYSSTIPEYRAAQSQAYHQTFVVLSEMGAPADVSDWYAQAGRRFSAPLVISPAVQAQAQAKYVSTPAYTAALNKYTPATEADLAADLAGMEEVKEISVQSAAQKGKVDAWLERVAPAAAWDAQVGFYAAALQYQFSRAGGVYPQKLIASANSLLQTAPPNTPEAVSASLRTLTSDLSKIGPVFGDGLVIIIPKSGTPSADAASQQIEQDYQSLCRAYGISPTAARQAALPDTPQTVLALLNKAQAAADKDKTLTADFSYVVNDSLGSLRKDTGTIRLMKPNYADIAFDTGLPTATEIHSDGQTVWTYHPATHLYEREDADPQGRNINVWRLITVGGFFSVYTWVRQGIYADPSELHYRGKEVIDGVKYDVLEHLMTGHLHGKPVPFDQKVFFGPDGLIRRFTLSFTLDGKPGTEYADLTNIHTGTPMLPADFAYAPPVGASPSAK